MTGGHVDNDYNLIILQFLFEDDTEGQQPYKRVYLNKGFLIIDFFAPRKKNQKVILEVFSENTRISRMFDVSYDNRGYLYFTIPHKAIDTIVLAEWKKESVCDFSFDTNMRSIQYNETNPNKHLLCILTSEQNPMYQRRILLPGNPNGPVKYFLFLDPEFDYYYTCACVSKYRRG